MPENDVLLLIGHGSVRYPDAAGALHRHADALRRRKRFAHVAVGLLNGTPSVTDALAGIDAAKVIGAANIQVVPFFMEDGYFTRVAVPRALGGRPVTMRPPVGIHDAMAGSIQRQALAACADLDVPPRDAAVLVVGHGSASTPGRTLALHRHTERVARAELFARVETACLEEAPFVAGALSGLRDYPVVVIGFFANLGGHTRDDVPALIAAEVAYRGGALCREGGRAVRFHGSVADDPAMTGIIQDQARR